MFRVLYGGCFDLFHCGHLRMFKKIKEMGFHLTVYVASDKEIIEIKGKKRPIIPGKERAEMLEGCKYIDKVLYSEDFVTNEEWIRILKPDIYIQNSGGYNKEDEDVCTQLGVSILKLPREIPPSRLDTTKIIKKCKA